ncbi:MAG: phosphate ABC transporter substrate-binding protein, partial [Verrucomicrobia bacterium]
SALDARYQPEVVLQGRLRSVGSDTMDLLVGSWERVFRLYHPSLRVIHEGRGTSTATPALMENQSDIGPMSRPLLDAETARFRERFGYDATQIRTALDALGIYVHPDNPLAKTGLTLAQVDAIFSSTRNRGESEHIATWGQLGLGAEWANAPIRAYGRNRASGTYGFFRDTALGKGEFGAWVAEQPSSALVVTNVEGDKFGIGFSGVGYRTDGVAMVPLAKEAGGAFVSPSETTALDGSYALARPLLIALNRNPELPLSDLQREFTTFILGPIGQEIVKQEGYYPLPREIINEELAKLR